MFFSGDSYFRFVDEARTLGITIPVVPGIMPITNASGIIRFADACGADVPRWMRLRLQAFGDDVASIRAFGLDVITNLCERLRTAGVPGFHFYTMNKSTATLEICRRLGLS
jgi:methylenetetrahydrofolate reductase (NADPH)